MKQEPCTLTQPLCKSIEKMDRHYVYPSILYSNFPVLSHHYYHYDFELDEEAY